VYEELRRLAHRELRHEGPDATLVTTALVHEAYLRLVDQSRAQLEVSSAAVPRSDHLGAMRNHVPVGLCADSSSAIFRSSSSIRFLSDGS
jgi:hypothetical protein